MLEYEFLGSDAPSPALSADALGAVQDIAMFMAMQADTPLAEWWKTATRFRWTCLETHARDFDFKSEQGQNYVTFLTTRVPDGITFALEEPNLDDPGWNPDGKGGLVSLVGIYTKRGRLVAARIVVINGFGRIEEVADFGMTGAGLNDPAELLRFREGIRRYMKSAGP
jgi:hypothetical protein